MDYRNRMFRRLSIIFLIMAMVSIMLFIFLMFFIAKDEAFTCPEEQYFCYISEEVPIYRTAIYGLSFSIVLLLLLSSLFSKQVEFVAEYSGYTKSISEKEREKINEESKASSALKEYFLHLEALEKEKTNKENQLSMSDITGEKFVDEKNEIPFSVNDDDFNIEQEIVDEEIHIEVNEPIEKVVEENTNQEEIIDKLIKIEEKNIKSNVPKELETEEIKNNVKTIIPRKTKKDFEKIIFEETSLNKTKSKLFLKTILNVITEEIKQGNVINLNDFGKFRKNTYKSRNAINPKTKEKIIIEEHSVARFYPSKKFISILSTTNTLKNNKSNIDIELSANKTTTQKIKIKKEAKPVRTQTLTKSNNKKEMILKISMDSGLSKNKSKEFLNAFIETVTLEMQAKNSVDIPKFGKFSTIERAPKQAVNPQTKEKILIPSHTAVKFKFNKDFKQKLNQNK